MSSQADWSPGGELQTLLDGVFPDFSLPENQIPETGDAGANHTPDPYMLLDHAVEFSSLSGNNTPGFINNGRAESCPLEVADETSPPSHQVPKTESLSIRTDMARHL
jgi:hypothetical protein